MAARVSSAVFSRARSFSSCSGLMDGAGFRGERLRVFSRAGSSDLPLAGPASRLARRSELARLSDTRYPTFVSAASACPQNIQSHQRTLGLGEVPNDFLYWRR